MSNPDPTDLAADLERRMARPQRHRLLHGYPMTPLLRPGPGRERDGALRGSEAWITPDPTRPLLVGVMPHTQCAPSVEGCGFCTFPHDPYHKPELRRVVRGVVEDAYELGRTFRDRRVEAVYLGGATANLTPVGDLRALLVALAHALDLSGAELTLEGVPSLFRSWLPGTLGVVRDAPVAARRISMGVQTFDPVWIGRMGRAGFGDRATVATVVSRARASGLTVSVDLLVHLPGRSERDEVEDVRIAVELGVDQICLYPLVLDGDTPWARDPSVTAAMPSVAEAHARWRRLVATVQEAGYTPTTVTNFERGAARFRYEVASFAPDRFDAVGIGPLSISTLVELRGPEAERGPRAVKILQGRSSRAEHDPGRLWFPYTSEDFELLMLTRCLAAGAVDRARFRAATGRDLAERHWAAVDTIVRRGLATLDAGAFTLTEDGRFFADAVVGSLAAARAATLRAEGAGVHTSDLARGRVLTTSMG